MENQIENKNQEDEISLIDLFAVLIRYRKVIIIVTFLTTFLTGLYLFVLPILNPSTSGKKVSLTYTVDVSRLPISVEKYLNQNNTRDNMVFTLFSNDINNLTTFASVYKKYPVFSEPEKLPTSEAEYNLLIKNILENKTVAIEDNPIRSSTDIILEVSEDNKEKADAFVSELVGNVNKSLMAYMLPLLENLQSNTAETIALARKENAIVANSSQELQQMLLDLNSYLLSLENFALVEGEPFIMSVAQGRMMKLVIVTFASFFISVFIAFVLNAINNVKADPAASKVISDAWKAGK